VHRLAGLESLAHYPGTYVNVRLKYTAISINVESGQEVLVSKENGGVRGVEQLTHAITQK
jgi:hypothetical protein